MLLNLIKLFLLNVLAVAMRTFSVNVLQNKQKIILLHDKLAFLIVGRNAENSNFLAKLEQKMLYIFVELELVLLCLTFLLQSPSSSF